MRLTFKDSQTEICADLKIAQSFADRTRGLIGTKHLDNAGLWIERCYWIHTFFMSIPIDVVYVDSNLKVKKVDHSVRPWRWPLPVFSARSVIELPAGLAKQKQIHPGDQLHVGN